MNGVFAVAAQAPPPDTAKPLKAKVSSAAVTLDRKSVAAGAYSLTVADRSRTRNFHVVGPGVDRRTGRTFTGTVTWRLDLAAGTYRYRSDPRLAGRLAVRAG